MSSKSIFKDRQSAGALLLERIDHEVVRESVLVAIPNGGIPVAMYLAEYFGVSLHIVLSKKIPLKGMPYVGLGSVSSHFESFNEERVSYLGLSDELLQECSAVAIADVQEKKKSFSHYALQESDVVGKDVLVVDDGVASGFTMISACKEIMQYNPKKIRIATPVISTQAKTLLEGMVSDLYCVKLSSDVRFVVDDYFENFQPVSNQMVFEAMEELRRTIGGI